MSGSTRRAALVTSALLALLSPLLAQVPATAAAPSYVALGDSFTAAPGIPETDGSDGCLRSSHNYPSLVAEQLGNVLGRSVVVLQKFGAGQRIAVGEVRRAPPDGRTLLFATNGPFSIYPNIYRKLDYDPVADFTPIVGVSSFDVGIATGPGTGATDLKQLVEWARTRSRGA